MKKFFALKHHVGRQFASLFVLFFMLAGCATNPGIVKTGSDTYTLYKSDHGGIFGNPELLRNHVINQANTFAENQGKIAYPVSAKSHPMGILGDFASFEYRFRLADKNDPNVPRTHLVPGSDVVVDESGMLFRENSTANHATPTPARDKYSELYKLDDLHKKGVINDQEFEAQKKKLLDEN